VGFQRVIDNLPFLSDDMQNIVRWRKFHLKKYLIGLDFTDPFHGLGVEKLDRWDFLSFFVQENYLISFLVVLNVLDDQFLEFYFRLNVIRYVVKYYELIVTSWDYVLELVHLEKGDWSDEFLVVLKGLYLL